MASTQRVAIAAFSHLCDAHRQSTMNESNGFTGDDAHGTTEAGAGARGPGDRAEARRPVQPRHHLRAGHSRVDVLPLDRRPQEQAAARVKRGTKKEEATFKQTLLTTIRAAELARNQYWTAAAWLLERKYPDEHGKADEAYRQPQDPGGDGGDGRGGAHLRR